MQRQRAALARPMSRQILLSHLGGRGRNTCLFDADMSVSLMSMSCSGCSHLFNLSHVVSGEADLPSTISRRAERNTHCAGVVGKFLDDGSAGGRAGSESSRLSVHLPISRIVLIVDTAAGISPKRCDAFVQAAQHPVVVVRDEPASLTDAYALIKVFSQNYGVSRFQVVTNQTRNTAGVEAPVSKSFRRVTDHYLDVVLRPCRGHSG